MHKALAASQISGACTPLLLCLMQAEKERGERKIKAIVSLDLHASSSNWCFFMDDLLFPFSSSPSGVIYLIYILCGGYGNKEHFFPSQNYANLQKGYITLGTLAAPLERKMAVQSTSSAVSSILCYVMSTGDVLSLTVIAYKD